MVVNFTRFLSKLILPFLLTTIFQTEVEAKNTGYGTFPCKTYGRYPDPNDCKSYYECFPTFTSARLTVQKQKCPAGKGFHDKLKKCVSLKKLKDCNSRQARFENINEELNTLCTSTGQDFLCSDCQTLVHCINNVAYMTQCDAAEWCSERVAFDEHVCAPNLGEGKCSCNSNSNNTYLPDPYEPTKFFTCDSKESLPVHFECPINRVFNDSLQKCTDEKGLPSCSAEGTFAVPKNCSKYYSCIQSKYGWLQKAYECEANQMFSESSGTCEDPCLWQSGDFTCTEEGRFSNPSDCKTFFVCIKNQTEFILKKRSCPNSFYWLSSEGNNSGKCTDDISQCKPATQSHCDIPADRCTVSSPNEEPTATPVASEADGSGPTTTTPIDNTEAPSSTEGNAATTIADNPPEAPSSTEGNADTTIADNPTEAPSSTEGSAATTIEEDSTSPTTFLRTASEELKREDPIAFIRNLLTRP